jgi:PAS domain-containing protein
VLPEDFLTFADPLPESMVLTSGEGIILAANRATENILGRSISDLCGKPLAGFVTDPADELAILYPVRGISWAVTDESSPAESTERLLALALKLPTRY